jgi:hypothetical protein
MCYQKISRMLVFSLQKDVVTGIILDGKMTF